MAHDLHRRSGMIDTLALERPQERRRCNAAVPRRRARVTGGPGPLRDESGAPWASLHRECENARKVMLLLLFLLVDSETLCGAAPGGMAP